MYTICYIAFFVLSTAAAFKNDKGNQMHFTNNKTRYTLPLFITACSHNENANNSNFNRNYFMGGNFGSEEVHFDFKGGATTALGGATIAD